MRKTFLIFTVFVLFVTICGCGNNDVNNDFEYSYEGYNGADVKASLTHYNGNDSIVQIPDQITAKENGKVYRNVPVDWIERYAFCNNSLREVVIPDSVRGISEGAFIGCRNFESVVLPESITVIGDLAFADCSVLKWIKIPKGVTYIAPNAFYKSDALNIICEEGSYAKQYAGENNIPFTVN